jgi:hypothetical protein
MEQANAVGYMIDRAIYLYSYTTGWCDVRIKVTPDETRIPLAIRVETHSPSKYVREQWLVDIGGIVYHDHGTGGFDGPYMRVRPDMVW